MTTSKPSRPTTVWVHPLDSGCGICAQQVYALLSSRYAGDMASRGIRFARSPRHADVVLLTGPLAEAAREPLDRVLATVPEPRALVAVGNCAIDGCVFRGSAQIVDDAAEALDVNVEIAGCPPAPAAILDAIVEAALLLAGERGSLVSDSGEEEADAEAEESDELGEIDEGGDAGTAVEPDDDPEGTGNQASDGDEHEGSPDATRGGAQ